MQFIFPKYTLNALRQSSYNNATQQKIKYKLQQVHLRLENSFYWNLITIIYHFWLCLAVEGKRQQKQDEFNSGY